MLSRLFPAVFALPDLLRGLAPRPTLRALTIFTLLSTLPALLLYAYAAWNREFVLEPIFDPPGLNPGPWANDPRGFLLILAGFAACFLASLTVICAIIWSFSRRYRTLATLLQCLGLLALQSALIFLLSRTLWVFGLSAWFH